MEKLTSVQQFEEFKQDDLHVFLFTANWCPDCRFLDPFLPSIEDKYQQFSFVSVDRDEFIDLCGELDIFGIPSFIVFENGNEIGRLVSKDRKTKEEVEKFLDSLGKN